MKYKLLGQNNYLEPLETVLKNRGIEDIQSFLNIQDSVVLHWSKLKNMKLAIECLMKHIKGGGKVFVQVDADP